MKIFKFEDFINESSKNLSGKEIVKLLDDGKSLITIYSEAKKSGLKDALKYMDDNEDNEDNGDWSKINKITLAKKLLDSAK